MLRAQSARNIPPILIFPLSPAEGEAGGGGRKHGQAVGTSVPVQCSATTVKRHSLFSCISEIVSHRLIFNKQSLPGFVPPDLLANLDRG